MGSNSNNHSASLLRQRVLSWLDSMHVKDGPIWQYKMNASSDATPFNSCFAIFIKHLFGEISSLSDSERQAWIDYLQSFQQKDSGFFCDPAAKERVTDPTHDETHLTHQLTTFCLSALDALGAEAQYPLSFLSEWKNPQAMNQWLDNLDWTRPWNSGNKVMFLAICMTYQWEHFHDEQARDAIDVWFDWMDAHQSSESGFWGTSKAAAYFQGMGGFYHQFVIYNYFGRPVNHAERVVDRMLFLKQRDGLFFPGVGGGTCDDIDGIEPMIYFYHRNNYRRVEIKKALSKALASILKDQNEDGGFAWAKRANFGLTTVLYNLTGIFRYRDPYMWYYCNRKAIGRKMRVRKNGKIVTGWNKLGRYYSESSLFDTWLRCTTIAEICSVLTDEPLAQIDWKSLTTPGVGWFNVLPTGDTPQVQSAEKRLAA